MMSAVKFVLTNKKYTSDKVTLNRPNYFSEIRIKQLNWEHIKLLNFVDLWRIGWNVKYVRVRVCLKICHVWSEIYKKKNLVFPKIHYYKWHGGRYTPRTHFLILENACIREKKRTRAQVDAGAMARDR